MDENLRLAQRQHRGDAPVTKSLYFGIKARFNNSRRLHSGTGLQVLARAVVSAHFVSPVLESERPVALAPRSLG